MILDTLCDGFLTKRYQKGEDKQEMANVLIVDDDDIFSEMLSDMVVRLEHNAFRAVNIKEGLEKTFSGSFDVVFLDIHLPDGNGLDILPKIREASSRPEIIIITGSGDSGGAELALKNGVWDYIEKPSSMKEMQLPFIRALQYREERASRKPAVALKLEGIIGSSPRIKACFDLVAQAAQSDASVLITGETGTGKELIASAIHNNSPRSESSFVVVDCASLPQTLVESIIFGHERGAFTGADKAREGLIKQAHGGTLFLDEIGELPIAVQKSFLRVLQEHRFRPLGSNKEIESNFRLISATNRNLHKMVEEGHFREDLLFRVRTLSIDLPPLRERPEDVKELLVYYMTRLCERYGVGLKGFAPEFLAGLMTYSWPGNVRELIGTVEKAISEAFNEPTLFSKHLPLEIRVGLKKTELSRNSLPDNIVQHDVFPEVKSLPTLGDYREKAVMEAEKSYLDYLIKTTDGNIKEACRISGLSRPRLYALLKKYNTLK
jgi:two-component system, NtrC family, response regulator